MRYFSSVAPRLALAALLALGASVALADTFGPSADTIILTGHGYEPSRPLSALGSPFKNLDTNWETSTGVGAVRYRLEISTSATSSTQEQYFGAELQGRVGFYKAKASLDLSSQKASFRSAFTLNIYAKVDFGTEYLANQTSANLTEDAKAIVTDAGAWMRRYGTQVVTRRRRGALVVASVVFNSHNATAANAIKAQLAGSGAGVGWSAGMSAGLTQKISEAIQSLNGSVSIVGYGGEGFKALVPPKGANLSDFQTFVTLINDYMGKITRENSGITEYMTSDYTNWVVEPGVTKPFAVSVADAYLRYVSLQSKYEALSEYLESASISTPWVLEKDLNALGDLRDKCKANADKAWKYGETAVNAPEKIGSMELPGDVDVRMPRYELTAKLGPPQPNGDLTIQIMLKGARGIICEWHVQEAPSKTHFERTHLTQERRDGTYYEIRASANAIHDYPNLWLQFYDQNGADFFKMRVRADN